MIRVKKGTVKVDGEKYIPGDIIYDLTEREEQKLISSKVAEPWGTVREVYSEDETEKEANDGIDRDPIDEKNGKESSEVLNAEKELSTETRTGPAEQPLVDDIGAADKIDIKFDAAAYVGDTAAKKTKAGK
jgi:hypothetical protein